MAEKNFLTLYFYLGVLLTSLFSILISKFMFNFIKDFGKFTPPTGIHSDVWNHAFGISEEKRKLNKYIGFLESILFFFCFYIDKPELIGGWLTFKLASKWEVWNTIMKIPEKLDDDKIPQIEYIGAKNEIAWFTLQRWLFGTLANIVAALFGLVGSAIIIKILSLFV